MEKYWLYTNLTETDMKRVLPKGTVEKGETHIQTALREVKEEADVNASIVKYVGKSHYNFTVPEDMVTKEVHWYLMTADNYHSRTSERGIFLWTPGITSFMKLSSSPFFQ